MIAYIIVGVLICAPILIIGLLFVLFLIGAGGVPSNQYGRTEQTKAYRKIQKRKLQERNK